MKSTSRWFRLRMVGVTPLLHHSIVLADVDGPAAKSIAKYSGKRKKTEEDRAMIARLEMQYGMYYDDEDGAGPYLPSENIHKSLREGGVITKSGMKIMRGVIFQREVNPLEYEGPRDMESLLCDPSFQLRRMVTVNRAKVARVRPIFRKWRTEAYGIFNSQVIDLDELGTVASDAGMMVGVGDFRPRFGRYRAKVEECSPLFEDGGQ